MNRRALAICLLSSVLCPLLSPAAPKPVVVKGDLVCRTKQQDAELGDWINGLQINADKALLEARSARDSIKPLNEKLALASQDGINLAKERDQAVIDKNHVLKKLHFLKWGVSALATLLIVFVMLKLAIPPPLSFYIGGAAIVAANAAIWTFL